MTYIKRIITLFIVTTLLLTCGVCAFASDVDHRAAYEATRDYMLSLGTPTVGSVGGEWMVIALCRDGVACPEGYYENVVSYVNTKINDKGQLHKSKSTDNSRVILGLSAAGYDVTDVGGHNLLCGLTDMTYLKKQGINGPIWALIALDCLNYSIPDNPSAFEQATREGIIAYILEKQLEDGGWAMSGKKADPDMTGMAIQSLARYYDTSDGVRAAVDRALVTLSDIQQADGGYGSVDGSCSESCAQVIVALTTLGINPHTDPRFVKNGLSVVDAMCSFAIEGGGFAHIPNATLNGMATEQGQYALVAYYRFLEGKNPIYDMTEERVVLPEEDDTAEVTTSKPEDKATTAKATSKVTDKQTDNSEDTTSKSTVAKTTDAKVTVSKTTTAKATNASPTGGEAAQTADSDIAIYIAFAVLSAMGVIFTVCKRYRIN